MLLDKKTAIVTGAGQGIGKAIVTRLAQEGASVLVNDLAADKAEAVAASLRGQGFSARAHAADVSDEASVRGMVNGALNEWGRVDILVSNAGYLRLSAVVNMSLEEWEQVFAVDSRGVFLCSREVLPGMIERRSGRIITIASIAAYVTRPLEAHYCAAKAAAVQFAGVRGGAARHHGERGLPRHHGYRNGYSDTGKGPRSHGWMAVIRTDGRSRRGGRPDGHCGIPRIG